MDSKSEGEEMTYPFVCFTVDNFDEAFSDIQVREGFKNPSHGICPLGGFPPPLLNGRENLAKKVNGKGGYSPPP